MSDHYVKVKVQLEQMKTLGGNGGKDGNGEDAEEQQLAVSSSSPASVSPDPSSTTIFDKDEPGDSITSKHKGKVHSRQGKDDKNSSNKPPDLSSHGPVSVKNQNRLEHGRTLHIRGTGKILQAKSQTNRDYVTICDDGFKVTRKRRPVTVDTSKAKTSLEALKISIKLLKWKEVSFKKHSYYPVFFLSALKKKTFFYWLGFRSMVACVSVHVKII